MAMMMMMMMMMTTIMMMIIIIMMKVRWVEHTLKAYKCKVSF
jgi:hypothetical protein